ncbi:HD domain-containing phosphohydrolase [Syntrophus aciditrophicus]|nr:HD domain-containing phosphohydrolase [Syntrophus aciditrophicus]
MDLTSRILIVDDLPQERWMLGALLKSYDYELSYATNGHEALELAKKINPDLILLDVMMPGMDGFEVCRRIRKTPLIAEVPIMMVTALNEAEVRRKGVEIGADDFISKPFDRAELQARVRNITRLNRHRRHRLHEERVIQEKLFNALPDGLMVLAENGTIQIVNPALRRMLLYRDSTELMGRTLSELLAPDYRETFEGSFHRCLSDPSCMENNQLDFLRRDGSRMTAELTVTSLAGEGMRALQVILRDITDRIKTESRLRESEEQYRVLFMGSTQGILATDMETKRFTFANPAVCRMLGYSEEELLRLGLADIHPRNFLDCAVIEFELQVRGEREISSGIPYLRKDGTVFYADTSGSKTLFKGRECHVSFLTEVTQRKLAEETLELTLNNLKKAFAGAIQVMVSAVEARDSYTAGHQRRTADLASTIAGEMGLSQEKIDAIRMAGSIHDIGKLFVPSEILCKPAKLFDIEFTLIKEHPRQGFEILKDVDFPWPLADIIYQHHERIDGSGYPRNLKGDDILVEARILSVADTVEAMASHRPYRPGLGLDLALEEIEKNRGIFYDCVAVDACLRLFREKGYNFSLT